MASTAAASPPFLSPRPTQRAAAMAAASVTRTSSMAKLRSGASPRAACGCPSSTSYVASVVSSPILGWDVTRTPRVVTAGPHRGKGHGRWGRPAEYASYRAALSKKWPRARRYGGEAAVPAGLWRVLHPGAAPARHQVVDHNNDGGHDQHVDDPGGDVKGHQSEQPQHHEDRRNGPQHDLAPPLPQRRVAVAS